ncbi:monovalent cation/H+ antiporter complex subunit F [Candidatus Nitrotoga sp. M5]|uniref:monovalent cation/H+ antiporter complex subunit F n=1 Tax=Candidatus Nitrotoga sp. M5 TaxID=2890409 RepID=UPI001EF19E8D|nr:monovalent cation/H+ antiporter complex subunit F [Candidatus Nitrotoga sp. M5]
MTDLYLILAAFLLLNLLMALWRIARGPTPADRLLASLLFGTGGVAVLLLLAYAEGGQTLVDAALVFTLLAVITGAAFVRRVWGKEGNGHS